VSQMSIAKVSRLSEAGSKAPINSRPSFTRILVRTTGPGARGSSRWQRKHERPGLWFVTPFLVLFALFLLAPVAYAVYTSLYSSTLIGGTHFSGVSNYTATFSSAEFWDGFRRVVVFWAVQVTLTLLLAGFLAVIFDIGLARFGRFFRTVFFVPFAVPAVVASVMWSFLLVPEFGPFTKLAGLLGFHDVDFFSPNLVLLTIIVIVIWEFTGYNMIILYAALKAVPREVVEAAIIDGAPLRKLILRVKLPMIRPAMVMLLFLNTVGALQLFTEPMILAAFEPQAIPYGFTPMIFVYNTSVGSGEYNLGAAAAVVLGFMIFLISFGSLLVTRRSRGGAR
jgi:multiple sugar transport system permease protein